LASAATRAKAAAKLAVALGAESLLLFVRAPDVDTLVPTLGIDEVLPNEPRWRAFVEECAAQGESEAMLPVSAGREEVPVIGIGTGHDVVLVLANWRRGADLTWLRSLLPLIGQVVCGEQVLAAAEAELRTARTRLETQADELSAANAALDDARIVAIAASRAKSEFLATMSHELRTPLNAIAGHVQLMSLGLHGPVTEEQQQALARIDRSARHLLGLINDILNLSRLEAGRLEYDIRDVSLCDLLADIKPMIEPQTTAKSLQLDFIDPESMPTVRADREKLQQIFLNLLSNAVKFTPSGGRVWIDASRRPGVPGKVFVRVMDTGEGIPSDKIEAIFDPFTQVDASHSRIGQGTGLGLSISRDLARGMGGDLRARSEPGAGSTFTLTLREAATRNA